MKVNITFLDQIVCDYYDFLTSPDLEAIRPSVSDIELITHTKKAIKVKVGEKDYWIAKSLIRSITQTIDNNLIFENEPYYNLYYDKLYLSQIKDHENKEVIEYD